jgi:carboxypeptidase C (cathepsin A)
MRPRVRHLRCAALIIAAFLATLITALPATALAQDAATQASADQSGASESGRPGRAGHEMARPGHGPTTQPAEDDTEKSSSTDHDITVNGQTIHYRATAAQLPLKDEAGKVRAHIFYISYEKLGPDNKPDRNRPVTFVFNGGPGSASVWLHLGTAGPRRVNLPDDGMFPKLPHHVVDNPFTWLAFTDMVMIDPVGTGYSRVVPDEGAGGGPGENAGPRAGSGQGRGGPETPTNYYSAAGDVASVGDFIRLWTTNAQRWTSPKFVAGESYGTTRAAALSDFLIERYGIDLSGIVLISTVLNFGALNSSPGNDLPYPLYISTYTACAWYHKKLPPDLQNGDLTKAVAEAKDWALGDYTTALQRGSALSDAQQKDVLAKLVRFTGLPSEYVDRSNMRISPGRFEHELLADQQKVIGRFDGRVTGHSTDPLNDSAEFDPSEAPMLTAFTGAFNDYIRRDLKYDTELNYEVLSSLVHGWSFDTSQGYYNVGPALASAMTKNPSLKVLVCCGYYDLATPLAGAEYQINTLPLGKDLRANVSFAYYESGHMVYLPTAGAQKLAADMGAFYQAAMAQTGPGTEPPVPAAAP